MKAKRCLSVQVIPDFFMAPLSKVYFSTLYYRLYLYLKPVAPAALPEIPAILGAEAVLSSPASVEWQAEQCCSKISLPAPESPSGRVTYGEEVRMRKVEDGYVGFRLNLSFWWHVYIERFLKIF